MIRRLGSVTTFEDVFEPIVYKTSKDARNDFLDELDKPAHCYHPLSVNNFKVRWQQGEFIISDEIYQGGSRSAARRIFLEEKWKILS